MTNRFCPSCGVELDPGIKFCPCCGATIEDNYIAPREEATLPAEDLTLFEYFVKCLKNYATFQGRARRKEFWGFYLFYAVFYVGITTTHKILYILRHNREGVGYFEIVLLTTAPVLVLFLLTHGKTKRFGAHWWAWLLSLPPVISFLYRCIYYPLLADNFSGDDYWPYYWTIQRILFFGFFLLPTLAAATRRMHDIGKSGAYVLWMFLPVLVLIIGSSLAESTEGMVAVLIFSLLSFLVFISFASTKGDTEANEYGPSIDHR